MDVQITTLTPLWIGGVDGTTDRLHESGLLGGMRWSGASGVTTAAQAPS